VVTVSEAEAAFADAMLNLLSMDFDIHNRYADLLRYNSFRRAWRPRKNLGRGFVFALIGAKPARDFDVSSPDDRDRWVKFYGRSVLDFGAGHLAETRMLRAAGVRVTPFEPYRLQSAGAGGLIDKQEGVHLARAFLGDVADGVRWSSVFLSSVLNSVPFAADRAHIVTICSSLCSPSTCLYAVASSQKQSGWDTASGGSQYLNRVDSLTVAFRLDYEDGIRLGEISANPKVQKYHSPREFYDLFKTRFRAVQVTEAINNVQAICADPLPVDPAALAAALDFEFDLPYPDGSRMGLAADARAAFEKRLGVTLPPPTA